jgi:GNAT superfamily N-acetyltransferase
VSVAIRAIGAHHGDPDPQLVDGLAEVLVDCVVGGASVSFLLPFDHDRALGYWRGVLDGAAQGERVVLAAVDDEADGAVLGTVQVVLAAPENQPHRGEIAKLLVHRRARRRGVADALMRAAEDVAVAAGKTLLVLDTASAEAERVYDRLGWLRVGVVPGYALLPDGAPCDTVIFYKQLA